MAHCESILIKIGTALMKGVFALRHVSLLLVVFWLHIQAPLYPLSTVVSCMSVLVQMRTALIKGVLALQNSGFFWLSFCCSSKQLLYFCTVASCVFVPRTDGKGLDEGSLCPMKRWPVFGCLLAVDLNTSLSTLNFGDLCFHSR